MVKKIFAAAAVLLAVSVSAFALDDSEISVPVLFNEGVSRDVFDSDMSSDEILDQVAAVVEQALEENGVPIPVTDVVMMYEDDYDEYEDLADMFDFVISNIPSRAKSGSIYSSLALLDFDEDTGLLYGFISFAHVKSMKDIMVYTYLFSAGE